MAFTADPLDVTDDQPPLWADSKPSYSNKLVEVSPVVILGLFSDSTCRSFHEVLLIIESTFKSSSLVTLLVSLFVLRPGMRSSFLNHR